MRHDAITHSRPVDPLEVIAMDTLLLLILGTIVLAAFANAATMLGVDSRDGFRIADGGPLA